MTSITFTATMDRTTCPRCGRSTHVEELGKTAGSIWLHCRGCGHLWRRTGPGLDAFSLILASRVAVPVPIEEECPPDGTPRAMRFRVRLYVRYRTADQQEWRATLTENISRSGIMFQAREALAPHTPVELILTLPGSVAGEPDSKIRCRGEVVREEGPPSPDAPHIVAATIGGYALSIN